jgi:predicted DsbA family dithiol-disulfide isomerase
MAGEPIRVEVWSDVVCPWCYIGKRRIEQAIGVLRDDPDFTVDIELVYRPFQLDPGARRGVSEPVADAYARKFGGPEQAAAVMARVTAAAADAGIEFHLERAQRANTADAHRLLWWALSVAGPSVQAALKESLMHAYFVDGENVGDEDVLVALAAECGLDPRTARDVLVTEDGLEALAVGLRRAAELGITAVPTYVIDGQWSIPGAQDAAVFEQVFRRLVARRAEPASA